MTWFAGARCSTSEFLMPCLVDRPSEYTCPIARMVSLYWLAGRVQPDRANRRAGTGPDGKGPEPWLHGMVASGRRHANRKVSRPRLARARPHEQRNDEGIHA